MTDEKQAERKSGTRPWLAVLTTLVLLGLTIYAAVKTGHVDPALLGADVVLALFWAGQAVDSFLPFR